MASLGRTRSVRRSWSVAAAVVLVAVSSALPAAALIVTKGWKPPCSVVNKADIGEIVGTSIARATNAPGPVPACLYFEASSDQAIVSIWLNAKPLGPAANTFSFDADQARTNDINRNFERVRGLGKKAFYFESDGLNRIEVLVGKRLFHVDGTVLTIDQAKAIATRVIKKS
jgi:hypothetical protein